MRFWLFLAFFAFPYAVLAHVSEQGFVLLLPTGGYILGGAATVALTVLALAFAPRARIEALFATRTLPFVTPNWMRTATQIAALMLFLLCLGFLIIINKTSFK